MFGVSPAFVLSGYGNGFSLENYCEALPRIRRLGFDAFQPEIYTATAVPEWLQGGRRVQRIATDLGLTPTQFVAHFMLEWFASPERLGPDQGLDDLKRVIEVTRAFPACRVLTVPAGQFQVEWGSPEATSKVGWREMQQRLIGKIRRYLEVFSGAGLRPAFEVGCPAGEGERHYRQGLEHLQELVDTPKGDRA